MSNRKLRSDLEELKKEVAKLREELAARPVVYIQPAPLPWPQPQPFAPATPPYPGWPDTIITCQTQPAPIAVMRRGELVGVY